MERERTWQRWLLCAVAAMVVVLVVTKLFIADLYMIPQNGMYPGLPQGSRFLAFNRPFHNPTDVRRGDIVVFTRATVDGPYTFVWRVIGLPGDRVEVGADSVMVNGHVLRHERLRTDGSVIIYKETDGDAAYEVAYADMPIRTVPAMTVAVPPGEFFVLGDNRDSAQDSRFNGTVPFASITAKLFR